MVDERASEGEPSDAAVIAGCLAGDAAVVIQFRNEVSPYLAAVLCRRGASPSEAEDLVSDLMNDCLAGRNGKQPLLRRFQPRSSLRSWLTTVATNRLIDYKRRQRFVVDVQGEVERAQQSVTGGHDSIDDASMDSELAALMRDALEKALADCPAEHRLMLSLVYIDGISQRKVAQMWGWHESKISRTLSQAMEGICTRTMENIRRQDPWLQLSWEDFVSMCEVAGSDFL